MLELEISRKNPWMVRIHGVFTRLGRQVRVTMRPVHMGICVIDRHMIDRQITVNYAEGGHVTPACRDAAVALVLPLLYDFVYTSYDL